ncbi:YihY/virulence factor BrkB family protein [Tuanshanicoccus lijuaniae]|uniref:YihY/virulence factor BrkB family protein n=1 Tax=Aerococcaceae bacterium zg-1292 TaxID=2774330 RepID=UPI001938F534|nr:YihY/virulence factor BrkB family protein [Aerococcaceae bacterium zg-1292]MBF6626762.1 YihY/virulence factor BrkB family protein [Aerococcaceae bacterium zg-BR9]MBF6978737.1 YihY/virulence factor BrkB family protein [Aerococcaceae bacterium zg-BR22]MBS4456868.1 YihY/virulence factor BrkB family protein [Aerococcaceae bacterium zg-A91]MBS4458756.1 YihY/virulence factor BrkB family protein [Aerococcaceae bacterium zg-BR33]
MQSSEPTVIQRLLKVFALNPQRKFGSYAAELSFYIIWAIIPLLLAFANVVSILPFSAQEIMSLIERALPNEVGSFLLPILDSYLKSTSSSAFSIALIISLWPASNVFNALQRILNRIFKAPLRNNAIIARGFSYVFTLAIVLVIFTTTIVFTFGEVVLSYISSTLHIDIPLIGAILQQGGLIGFIGLFLLMFFIYQFMPNVKWRPKYALMGAFVATIGFGLISQLFTIYLSFNKNIDSNSAIGIFIVALIWLYYNIMVIAIGAYVAVVWHDFDTYSYVELVEMSHEKRVFKAQSDQYQSVYYQQLENEESGE